MSSALPVSVVCCGLVGTTAADGGMLDRAYAEACATQGIVPGTAAYARCMVHVHKARGQSPVDVFRALFPDSQGKAEAAALSFERSYRAAVERSGVAAAAGAAEAIAELRDLGVRVCLVTSMSRRLLGLVLDTLGWWREADLTLSLEDVPRGFPYPDLMLTAMLRLGVEDVREAAFAGGTESGVLSGKRSGAGLVAGVLTGGHTGDRLRNAGATHLLGSIAELPGLVLGREAAGSGPVDVPVADASAASTAPQPRVPLERRRSGL